MTLYGAIYYVVQGGSNFLSLDETYYVTIQMKDFQYFM